MHTTDLIDRLASSVRPMPASTALRRVAVGVFVAAVIAFVLLWLALGVRPDLTDALLTGAFWRKWLFALPATAAAAALCMRLARPEASPGGLPAILALPFLLIGSMALIELQDVPSGKGWACGSGARR